MTYPRFRTDWVYVFCLLHGVYWKGQKPKNKGLAESLSVKYGRVVNMSRIGKVPIKIPEKVTVTFKGDEIEVKGPKGLIVLGNSDLIEYEQEGDTIYVKRKKMILGRQGSSMVLGVPCLQTQLRE